MAKNNGILAISLWSVAAYLFLSNGFVLLWALNQGAGVDPLSRDALDLWLIIAATFGPCVITLIVSMLLFGRIRTHINWTIVVCVAAVAAFFGGVYWLRDLGDFPFFGLPLMVFSGLAILALYRLPEEVA